MNKNFVLTGGLIDFYINLVVLVGVWLFQMMRNANAKNENKLKGASKLL